jgi:hypothetical protein
MDFREYIDFADTITDQTTLAEASTATRYSIEVNFRSEKPEILKAFSKICLGYVSAAMKQSGYHVKQVYEEEPIRLIISTRNWDDGEWVGMVHFHPEHDGGCFIISKGFYNKNRVPPTVSIQSTKKCDGDSAAEIVKELRNAMHKLRQEPDKTQERQTLKKIPLKRGPK